MTWNLILCSPELFCGLDLPAKYRDVLGEPGNCPPVWIGDFCGLGTSTSKDSEIGDWLLHFPDVQKTFSQMDFGHLDNSHCPSACSDCQFLETPSSRPWCKLLRHSHMGSSLLYPMILSMYSLLDLLIYHQKYLHLKTIVLKPCLNHIFFHLKSVWNLHIVG